MHRQGQRRAFTLIELVIVVLIMGIMAAAGVPRFVDSLSCHRVEAAAKRVLADLKLARSQAKQGSVNQSVQFTPSTDSYSLPGLDDMDHPARTYAVKLSDGPFQATIVSADFGGDAEIIFDGYGVPDSGGSVVLAVGGQQRTITVDATSGKAKVQ